jgi:hypothetical protein
MSESDTHRRLLIVGNPAEHHVGAHFLAAAPPLGIEARLLNVREAHSRNVWLNRFFHRLCSRRPAYLGRFSRSVAKVCREFRPESVLVTGISAPNAATLRALGKSGVRRINFLTDDPWNPANAAGFFRPALLEYDVVFSPREANMEDLRRHGCRRVEYAPFGYNPALHFPEAPQTAQERHRFACDVAFVGGADRDRFPLARSLLRAGWRVKLYGGYWDRDPELRAFWHGFVHGREFRLAVGGALVNVCIGRKANRDGHAMRSLELPAMRACVVVEDTPEHHTIFGNEAECVLYFKTPEEMVAKTKWLLANPAERERLRHSVHRHIVNGRHTYADRLNAMVGNLNNNS